MASVGVALGQYDNAFFTMGLLYNPFGSSMTFAPTMVSYYSGSGAATLGYDTGWVNSITYETPNFGGFTASLQFAPKETSAGGDAKNAYALSAAYNAGPLSVMGVYTSSGNTGSAAYTEVQKNFRLGCQTIAWAWPSCPRSTLKSRTKLLALTARLSFFQIGSEVPVTGRWQGT